MNTDSAVQKQIVGSEAVEKMYQSAPQDQMHFQHLLSALLWRSLTRNGIDVPTRELLTLSILVSLGCGEPLVKGHITANLNVGNDRAHVVDADAVATLHRIPAHAYQVADRE